MPATRIRLPIAAFGVALASGAAGILLTASLSGCAESPFDSERAELLGRIAGAAEEGVESPYNNKTVEVRETTARQQTDLGFSEERVKELDEMAGASSYRSMRPDVGPDLVGDSATTVGISLEEAVFIALENNLDLRSVSFRPAISQQALIAADAAFDWLFFTGVDWQKLNQPQLLRLVDDTPVGAPSQSNEEAEWITGVRKPLRTGGTFDASFRLNYLNDSTAFSTLSPDPSRSASLDFGLNQPLLRGFGRDSAEAEIRIAENQTRRAAEEARGQLLLLVREVHREYYLLNLAKARLMIQQRLLDRGIETRDVLAGRLEFDVRPAEYSDARARVESRRATLIRAQQTLREQSDRLKALLDSERFPLSSETLLLPTLDLSVTPITFSLLDAMTEALQSRPELQIALLNIDDAAIRQRFAQNAKLPLLDLNLRAQFGAIDDNTGDALGQIADTEFVNYIAGIQFEQPIGNRGPEAAFSQSRLQRLQSILDYAAAVRNTVFQVKDSLRRVVTNFALIEQTRVARLAAAENLRTLLVEEQTLRGLTPDFLNLKLNRQESLAQAELEEAVAVFDYKISLAEYYDAIGVSLERLGIMLTIPTTEQLLDRGVSLENGPSAAWSDPDARRPGSAPPSGR
jgi:outer membrane protein TolC